MLRTPVQEANPMVESARPAEFYVEPPDISHLVIEDGAPVDGLISERQMRLMTGPLYESWDAGGRKFAAFANVGLFYGLHEPPIVPDVMLSLDVKVPEHPVDKRDLSYFVWEYGKPPDVAIEVVSNREGGEIAKLEKYARAAVPYVVVFDPEHWLGPDTVRMWQRQGSEYVQVAWTDGAPLLGIGLGLKLWEGTYQDMEGTWLRWCDDSGVLIPTGTERAEAAGQRAEAERQRAEAERQRAEAAELLARQERERADALLQRLRELGDDV